MKEPTPTTCAAVDCDRPCEGGKFYCSMHSSSATKGEVKRVRAEILGKRARSNIMMLFVLGVLITGVGVLIAAGSESTYTVTEAGLVQTGSDGWYELGLFVGAVGSMSAFIAVVAWGVMLGMRAARE